MQILRCLAILAACLFFTSCIVAPIPPSGSDEINRAKRITEGVTTKAGVLDRLGQPDIDVGYFEYRGTRQGWGRIIILPPLAGVDEGKAYVEWARIAFDEHDVVNCVITSRDSDEKQAACQPHLDEALERHVAVLRAQAFKGDTQAALELARRHGEFGAMTSRTNPVDAGTAYEFYIVMYRARREGTAPDAWRLLCRAANGGNPGAQKEVGHWQRVRDWPMSGEDWVSELNLGQDNRIAYMWYTIAASNGDTYAAAIRENVVVPDMTLEEIADAKEMVGNWQSGDCPSPMHRIEIGP